MSPVHAVEVSDRDDPSQREIDGAKGITDDLQEAGS
jgi:hypothetical protein